MECKNCNLPLRTDYSFCSNCGAKIIRNRITIRNLWYDFTERFFNVDNTFFKTFKNLFSRPDDVIAGYVNGVRKKYLNPVSYFTIAVTLGGLFVYLCNEFFPEVLSFEFLYPDVNTLSDADKFGFELQKKINSYLFKYQSLFYIAMLPFLALISKLVFINKKQFNFSEHFVLNIYAYSHMSIIINTVYILSLWNSKLLYYLSMGNLVFQIGFFSWVFHKVFKLSIKQTILKLLLFLLIMGILFVVVMVLGGVYLAFFTDTFKNLAPPK